MASKNKAHVESAAVSARAPWGFLAAVMVFVFWAGAVLMSLEIVGSRVLAPNYGSTSFTWGSLITVVLAALALGYLWGGRLGDRWPSGRTLGAIGLLSSVAVLFVPLAGGSITDAVAKWDLGPRVSPLVATLFLFFPAGLLLGMASPIAVRLCGHRLDRIGRTAGSLYALSTTGSILGTLVTSFMLIPAIGVSAILYCLTAVMAAVSLPLVLPVRRLRAPLLVAGLAAVLGVAWACKGATPGWAKLDGDVLEYQESAYHNIAVVDRNGCRWLMFNSQIESGIHLDPPLYPSACEYVAMLSLVRVVVPEPKRVLFIGGGGGVGPRAFLHDIPGINIDVVEIDPCVIDVSKRFFFLLENDRVQIHARDGRMYLRQTQKRYDTIVLDAFSINGQVPFHLMTQEFLREARDHLAPGGAVIMNLISGVKGKTGRLLQAQRRTFESVFPQVYCFPRRYPREGDGTDAQNIMLIGATAGERLDSATILSRATALWSDGRVSAPGFLRYAIAYAPDLPRDPDAVVFSDDFAPVELLQICR